MKLQHQNILGIVLINQLALLNCCAEAAGNVRITGVCGIAVNIGSDTALAD